MFDYDIENGSICTARKKLRNDGIVKKKKSAIRSENAVRKRYLGGISSILNQKKKRKDREREIERDKKKIEK